MFSALMTLQFGLELAEVGARTREGRLKKALQHRLYIKDVHRHYDITAGL